MREFVVIIRENGDLSAKQELLSANGLIFRFQKLTYSQIDMNYSQRSTIYSQIRLIYSQKHPIYSQTV